MILKLKVVGDFKWNLMNLKIARIFQYINKGPYPDEEEK